LQRQCVATYHEQVRGKNDVLQKGCSTDTHKHKRIPRLPNTMIYIQICKHKHNQNFAFDETASESLIEILSGYLIILCV